MVGRSAVEEHMSTDEDRTTTPPAQTAPANDLEEILGAIDAVGEMFREALKSLGTRMTEHYERTTKRLDDVEHRVRRIEERLGL